MILGDKEKRLKEKLRLNQAKLLLRGDKVVKQSSFDSYNL